MAYSKKLFKSLETPNHSLALKIFRHYNNSNLPNYFSTITKQKKGGEKVYVVKVYELIQK